MQIGSPRFGEFFVFIILINKIFVATICDQTWKMILKHVIMAPQYFNDSQVEKFDFGFIIDKKFSFYQKFKYFLDLKIFKKTFKIN